MNRQTAFRAWISRGTQIDGVIEIGIFKRRVAAEMIHLVQLNSVIAKFHRHAKGRIVFQLRSESQNGREVRAIHVAAGTLEKPRATGD